MTNIRCGDTLYKFIGCTKEEIERKAKGLLKPNSHRVIYGDGRESWLVDEVVFDSKQVGAACFEWDATGDKVAFDRVRYDKSADGAITRTVLKKVFRDFADV